MSNNLIYLPYTKFFQKILNYAGPVLVSVEIVRRISFSSKVCSDKIWYYVLETTRILIAHCSIMTEENLQLLMIIAHNIRNLYRLFGMDLSLRTEWRSIVMDVMYYAVPNANGTIYLSISNPVNELTSTSYVTVLTEFDGEDIDIKRYIGHCIYNLVGTRKNEWKSSMKMYSTLDI
jgi:hypothetical protein